MRSTSSPSPKSVTTHPVAPTTCANKPKGRAAKKLSAHSSEESPTPSGDNYKSTLAPRVESGPGTTPRGDSYIQRGRLNPEHRHFGSVSSRTHSNDNPARTRRRQRHHPTRTRTLKPCLLTQRGFARHCWAGTRQAPEIQRPNRSSDGAVHVSAMTVLAVQRSTSTRWSAHSSKRCRK